MTQYRLAALIGKSETGLSRYLHGRGEFTAEERTRVAEALRFPEEWLFSIPIPPPASGTDSLSMSRASDPGSPQAQTGREK